MKIPLESSKDTREYREGLDDANGAAAQNSAAGQGQNTGAQGGADLPKNERIQVEL